jgi:hypothetical protein
MPPLLLNWIVVPGKGVATTTSGFAIPIGLGLRSDSARYSNREDVNPLACSSSASSESARTVASGSQTIATRMAELTSVRLGDCTEVIAVTSLSCRLPPCGEIHAYPNEINSSSLRKTTRRCSVRCPQRICDERITCSPFFR